MSKAEDIAAGISLIGALKNLGGTGGGQAPTPAPAPSQPPPAPPHDLDAVDAEAPGPDTWTRADIDALIGCADSVADSLEVLADAVKLMIDHAMATPKPLPPQPITNHQRKR